MQNGNWIPVDKRIISLFAKDRPYTEAEAYLSLRIDLDNNQQKGLREYARIWKWSRGKVERFFKQLDYKTGENLSEIEEKRGRDKAVTKAGQSRDKAVTPTLIVFNNLNTPKKTKPRQSRDKAVTQAGHNYNTNTKTNTIKDKYIGIFDHWNEQKMIIHRVEPKSGNTTMRGAINELLKAYTEEEIKQAITTYAEIVKSKEYFFTHQWGLTEFLVRGFEKFADPEKAKHNYRANKNGKETYEEQMQRIERALKDAE